MGFLILVEMLWEITGSQLVNHYLTGAWPLMKSLESEKTNFQCLRLYFLNKNCRSRLVSIKTRAE